jgi:predicted AAA+ superfamily ATPase
MIYRSAKTRLTQLLGQFPAVALLGPRQVGKTTLALSLTSEADTSPLYLDLELPSDRAKLADPELYLSGHEDRLVILDEIHRLPEIFETLRGLIDRRKRKGRRTRQFLLLGLISCNSLRRRLQAGLPTWS